MIKPSPRTDNSPYADNDKKERGDFSFFKNLLKNNQLFDRMLTDIIFGEF